MLLVLMMLLLPFFVSGASAGTIIGSAHDFRTYMWNDSGEICLPCHTPHNAKNIIAPLWNHEVSTETYIMYDSSQSPTLDADVSSQPDGISKICLSCHDGTVAIENFGNRTDGTIFFFGPMKIGTDLSNDHPISFPYDTSLATTDGELYDPTTKLSGLIGSTGTINDDMLFGGRMECSSCHDVHNTKAVFGTKLLLKDNAGSALCLTCHNK
ncbi:MAG: cytochrome c3 family protein [Deltaproteobacteria bacterium]|nr:cytochrome c3 family protein [Deltaproteobacteria bacterium]